MAERLYMSAYKKIIWERNQERSYLYDLFVPFSEFER